ncbi:MAG: FeS-binding protein [Desulfobacterales bacterium]|nr:FeS-binding protein [Desulfobacterales bacterium]MCP4161825.1 FeS-binding protein [Deltaproteobacteria bacterium]
MNNKFMKYYYNIVIFFLILTGFGQMPIFKRFYIADIPGLGWLAEFYKTFFIHNLAATLLIVFIFYLLTTFLLNKKRVKLTMTGIVWVASLTGLLLTGILLTIKNFPINPYPPGFVVFLYLSHIALVMAFCMTALYSKILKKEYIIK